MRNETTVDPSRIREEIEGLRHLTTAQLKEKYRDAFGEDSRSNHKQFLFRRVAWRIQANAWGGLSERARRRALEIADDADLRIRAPKNFLKQAVDETRTTEARLRLALDPRLPLPGTPLIRRYQSKDIIVHVRADGGFECNGRIYKSLSKAVTEATGTRWNGFAFYNLGHRPGVKRGEQE
ncbi:MAG: DUF2924 domain-containing protein [Terracidiphilus sp.]|nr:DUF2924 domain-containing protein [Terracidiphilus sp.]